MLDLFSDIIHYNYSNTKHSLFSKDTQALLCSQFTPTLPLQLSVVIPIHTLVLPLIFSALHWLNIREAQMSLQRHTQVHQGLIICPGICIIFTAHEAVGEWQKGLYEVRQEAFFLLSALLVSCQSGFTCSADILSNSAWKENVMIINIWVLDFEY